jgi:hypothetical protein
MIRRNSSLIHYERISHNYAAYTQRCFKNLFYINCIALPPKTATYSRGFHISRSDDVHDWSVLAREPGCGVEPEQGEGEGVMRMGDGVWHIPSSLWLWLISLLAIGRPVWFDHRHLLGKRQGGCVGYWGCVC